MVLVFKTSVYTEKHASHLTPHLNQLLPDLYWNFDLEDCDKILRIAGNSAGLAGRVKALLHDYGFECEELE